MLDWKSYVHDKRFRKFLERIIFYSKKSILFKTAERNFLKWDLKLRLVSHSFRFFIHFLLSIFKTNFIFLLNLELRAEKGR